MNAILIFVFGSIFLSAPVTDKKNNEQKNVIISTNFDSHASIKKQNYGFEIVYEKTPHYLKSKK